MRSVPDVLELAAHGLPGSHRKICVATFQRLDAGLLVDANDVLVSRRLVVDAQNIVALLSELVVVRRQVHLLTMRLEVSVFQDATHGAVAHRDALRANMIAQQRCRPVRDWQSYVGWRATGLRLDPRGIGVRERKGGRPDLGASASLSTGASQSKRRRHSCTVRTWTPNTRAMSVPGTASAIMSSACARRTTRCSAFAGRSAAAICARASADNTMGTVGRPPCGRPTSSAYSIMRRD